MNARTFTFLVIFVSFSLCSKAQFDQVTVGPGYANQTYLTLSGAQAYSYDHTSWDIAFDLSLQGAGIIVNEAVASVQGPPPAAVELYTSTSTDFGTATEADMADRIYNEDVAWTDGAFNSVKNEADPFDLGWGSYVPANNSVAGTRVFFIRLRNGELKKLIIELLSGGQYTFKYANTDGSNEVTRSVSKTDYSGKTMVYYSIQNDVFLDLEPDNWDFVFTRYVTPLDDGSGNILDYTVTGALSNAGVQVAQANGVDPENINES
ncbi:MAG: HmuY family protein, partial [Bacteroidota bacterium]